MNLGDISLLAFIIVRPKNILRKLQYINDFENLRKVIISV